MTTKPQPLRRRGHTVSISVNIDSSSQTFDNQPLETSTTKSIKIRDSAKELLARISTKVTPISSSSTFIKIEDTASEVTIPPKEETPSTKQLPIKLERPQTRMSNNRDTKLAILNLNKTKRVPAMLPNYRNASTRVDQPEEPKPEETKPVLKIIPIRDEILIEHPCLSYDDSKGWLDNLVSPEIKNQAATLTEIRPARRRNKTVDLGRPNMPIDPKTPIQKETPSPLIEKSESIPLIKLESYDDSKPASQNALTPINSGSSLPVVPIVRKEAIRKRSGVRSLTNSIVMDPRSVPNKEAGKFSRSILTLETSKALTIMNQTESRIDPCPSIDDNKSWLETLVSPADSMVKSTTKLVPIPIVDSTPKSQQVRVVRLRAQLEKSRSNVLKRQNTWEAAVNSDEMIVFKLAEEVVANYRSYQKYTELNGELQSEIKNTLGQEGVLHVFIGKIGQHLPLSKRISRYILERANAADKSPTRQKNDQQENPEFKINQTRFEVFQRINEKLQDFNMKFRMQGLRTLENTFIKAHENFRMKRKVTLGHLNRVSPEKYEQLKSQCDTIEGLMPVYKDPKQGKFDLEEEQNLQRASKFTKETRTVNKKLDTMFKNLRSNFGSVSYDNEDE